MRKDGRSPRPSPRPTSAATALSREGVSLPLSAALAMAGISIFGLLVFYVLNYHVLASGPPQPQLTAFGHYEDVTKNAWGALADMMQPYQPGKVRSILPRLEDGMLKQYEEALKCRRRWNRTAEDPKDRLAAVYLHARAFIDDYGLATLVCSIQTMQTYLGPWTPMDMYVFVNSNFVIDLDRTLKTKLTAEQYSSVCVVGIPMSQWRHHRMHGAPYRLPGNENRYFDYLLMGQWRLLVPFNIMQALGYQYFVQLDEDFYLKDYYKVNMLDYMRKNDIQIANHARMPERWDIMYGLPELARFFLTSNRMTPGGSLWQHLNPPNMTGLFSPTENWWNENSTRKGYDTHMLYGNFLMMSAQLWGQDRVQDFITLAMASGGLERHRWQEQSVFAWVWLLFTEPHQLWELNSTEFRWAHTRLHTEYTKPNVANTCIFLDRAREVANATANKSKASNTATP